MNPNSRATPVDQRSSSIRNGCKTTRSQPAGGGQVLKLLLPAIGELDRIERRLGIAAGGSQRGEAVHQVVGVDETPRERDVRQTATNAGCAPCRRAPSQAGLQQQRRRARVELAPRRAEAARLERQRRERLNAPREDVPFLLGRQRCPLLVPPAVEPEPVPARGDLRDRVRIQLGVDRLDEERRGQPMRLELVEQPRQRDRHRRVVSDRRVRWLHPALQGARLAEIVDRQDERARQPVWPESRHERHRNDRRRNTSRQWRVLDNLPA